MQIINVAQVFTFFLVFARLAGLFSTAPVFSRKEIFNTAKLYVLIWMSLILFFVVPLPQEIPSNLMLFVMAFAVEYLVGFLIGFAADVLVSGIEYAGSLMDTQMGLSVASLLDPSSGRSLSLVALTLKNVSTMIFLILDGHHMVISAILQSFQMFPIASKINVTQGAMYVVELGAHIFYLAVILSAPIMLVVFMVDFGFGMLNRVAEHVNVFSLGFQIKPSIGLMVFLGITPGLMDSMIRVLEDVTEHVLILLTRFQI